MDPVRQLMLDLLSVAFRTAAGLLDRGHTEFWHFAVAVRPDGTRLCVVANEADFLPVLSAQPQTNERLSSAVVSLGPSMTTECLAANRDPDNEIDAGEEAVINRLRALAAVGEIVASAVAGVGVEAYDEDEEQPEPVVEFQLEHANGWTLLYGQPFHIVNGRVDFGEVVQFDHTAEVFRS